MNSFKDSLSEFTSWRQYLHANPELAHDESMTADFLVGKLKSFGLKVTERIGGYGVVATLKCGQSNKSIGLRADMDALPIEEKSKLPYNSKNTGVMHACGHDGHMVMLLAAAQYLAKSKKINGSVHFVFQPAEESNAKGSGAKAMIDDGLFDRFSMDSIYSMHNSPLYMEGKVAVLPGAIMASVDTFEVEVVGQGTHAAFPHSGNDPFMVLGQLLSAWQTIVSRNIDPLQSGLVSVTSIKVSDSWNVIPDKVFIKGTVRSLDKVNQEKMKTRFLQITESISKAFNCNVNIDYKKRVPVTFNSLKETEFTTSIAAEIVGNENIFKAPLPVMGAEDFSYMLEEKPGCYIWIGSTKYSDNDSEQSCEKGYSEKNSSSKFLAPTYCMVHDARYDFNDSVIPIGASIFSRLAETYLCE